MLNLSDACYLQAFSIPVIQIVYETLKDQQEGKKGRASVKTGGASETIFILIWGEKVVYLSCQL